MSWETETPGKRADVEPRAASDLGNREARTDTIWEARAMMIIGDLASESPEAHRGR